MSKRIFYTKKEWDILQGYKKDDIKKQIIIKSWMEEIKKQLENVDIRDGYQFGLYAKYNLLNRLLQVYKED